MLLRRYMVLSSSSNRATKHYELRRFVREPRTVDEAKAGQLLQSRPKGRVEIHYLDGNVESERLAGELQNVLGNNGWSASLEKSGTNIINTAGIAMRTGSRWANVQGKFGLKLEEPGDTLFTFLQTCVVGDIGGWAAPGDPSLGKDASVVLIGPKVW